MNDATRIVSTMGEEKFALYDEEEPSGLHVRYLLFAYGVLFVALLICMPKIWLSSSIYYVSRDINRLQTQSDLLKEENKRLRSEQEALRYHYFIMQHVP